MARMRILTNMMFWQSRVWTESTQSIYAVGTETPWPVWKEAWRLWRHAPAYDVVVTMGVRESFAFAFLQWITGRPSKQIMCEVFIDEPQQGLLWRIKTSLYRTLASRVWGIQTNSTAEIQTGAQRFNIPENSFRYVPLHTTIEEPALHTQDDGFIFAAGRSLRDYETLLSLADRLPLPLTIVCGHDDLRTIKPPPNVTVLREINRDEYLSLMKRCSFTVTPLRPTERSTGQVVVLEAMALGKAVIATHAPGTADIIRHGASGLLVPPRDPEALLQAIQFMTDHPEEKKKMIEEAMAYVRQQTSYDDHARIKLTAIHELVARAHLPAQPHKPAP